MIQEYIHEDIGSEIDAISGHYSFHKEAKLLFGKREVLYIVGSAVVDTSCCGAGGCGFAIVPGYIVSWKTKTDEQGKFISEVEPVSDKSTQKRITKLIEHSEIVNQVQFL